MPADRSHRVQYYNFGGFCVTESSVTDRRHGGAGFGASDGYSRNIFLPIIVTYLGTTR
jgi:hypothetical protein